ncbi:hypothetical protein ACVFYP_10530 [Roseomonas sp. F4]
MCEECRKSALGMVSTAQRLKDEPLPAFAQGHYRPPSEVIPKFNFRYVRLPTSTTFAHANGRPPEEIKASGGLDPAFSTEICYSGDSGVHERWFDRLVFAARWDPNGTRVLSKVAEMQGYGTDAQGKGDVFNYIFEAPAGTLIRSTNGSLNGEVCFPEVIPWAWIVSVRKVSRAGGGKLASVVVYTRA